MIFRIFVSFIFLLLSASAFAGTCPDVLDVEFEELSGNKSIRLCDAYQGKVILIVNTASKCGYTYQYDGLEKLYQEYKDEGLVVLGFPSNDFANQEPGTEKQIKSFCRLTYGVKFPMFEKTSVTSGNANPLYRKLYIATGDYPRWNFHKYLVDRNGQVVASFPSRVEPDSSELLTAIKSLL
jgi:glutathione peroxidase